MWTRLTTVLCLLGISYAPTPAQPIVADAAPQVWTFTLSAKIDGSGVFVFSDNELIYQHKHWEIPAQVLCNGQPWQDLGKSPDVWLALRGKLDLSHAWIVRRTGRDVVAMEKSKHGFNVYLADSPNGADHYSITIAIPLIDQSL